MLGMGASSKESYHEIDHFVNGIKMNKNTEGLRIKLADRKAGTWRIYYDGKLLDTLDQPDATPLIVKPAARAEFLTKHGVNE